MREDRPADRVDDRPLVIDEPEVTVGVATEEILGRHPRITGREDTPHDARHRLGSSAGPAQQEAHLVVLTLAHEPARILEEPSLDRVVRADPYLRAAGSGRPFEPTFAPETLTSTTSPSVDA